jgi:photosystem II stability/assembly factor-like uncharacterized protein
MSGRWFDSSRQIFWDNNQQDLSIPGSMNAQSATFDSLYAPELYPQIAGASIGANLTAVPSITPGDDWRSVAMSASGQYQSAVAFDIGDLHISSDYGATWQLGAYLSGALIKISVSASGQYQTAVPNGGVILISSDYGATWNQRNVDIGGAYYTSVSISASGQYQTAVVDNGVVYVSSDYGNTWTSKLTSQSWKDVAVSASGQYQTAIGDDASAYRSNDYGVSWTSVPVSSGVTSYSRISMSATGQHQAIVNDGVTGNIHVSNDYGIGWGTTGSMLSWSNIVVSASGQYMIAYELDNSYLWISTDYGVTWNTNSVAITNLSGMALSASGNYFTIVIQSDTIYTSTTPVILPNIQGSVFNISSLVGDIAEISSLTTSSFSTLTANIGSLNTSSIVINSIDNSTAQISSLTAVNMSSLRGQIGQLITSSIVSNNLSSFTAQISSIQALNFSTVQGTINRLTTSSIVSNNLSSFTGQISSLITLNVSSLRGQVGGLTTSSIVSNNLSSVTGQMSSLITLNISTVQETVNALTASSIVSNNLSSLTGQMSSFTALNISSLREQTGAFIASSIVSNNVSSLTSQVSSLITLNISTVQETANAFTASSIISNNISSLTSQVSSLITLNVSSLRGQVGGLTISSLGINCNTSVYRLDVNGNANVNDNLSFAGSPIPDLGGNYSALGLLGGNSYGYLYGAFNSLGDGIHLSYNHINCNLGTSANGDIRAYIPVVGGRTSQLDLGYGEIGFAVGNSNAVPTKKMFLNSNGLSIINPNPNFSWRTTADNNAIFTGTVANFNIGSSNFTMECYFNPILTPASFGTIMCIGTTATGGHEFRIGQRVSSDGLGFYFPISATTDGNVFLPSANVLQSNVWCHLALVRSTNFAYLYSNGTAILSTNAVSHTYNESKRLFLFSNPYPDPTGQGYINSARFIRGQALYTGNFAPPTQQLTTTTVGTSGPNVAASITGTVAFLGAITSTLTDSGPSAIALTVGGSPTSLVFSPDTFVPGTVANPSTLFTCLGSNIGINCNTPAYRLDVNGTGQISTFIVGSSNLPPVYSTNDHLFVNGFLDVYNTGQASTLIRMAGAFGTNYIQSGRASTASTFAPADIVFGSPGATSEYVRFTSNGRVGIGTASPAYTLDVTGTGRFVSEGEALRVQATQNSNSLFTTFQKATVTSYVGWFGFGLQGPAYSNYFGMQGSVSTSFAFYAGAASGASPSLFLGSNSRVGILTDTPAYTLDVNGTARLKDTLLSGTLTIPSTTTANSSRIDFPATSFSIVCGVSTLGGTNQVANKCQIMTYTGAAVISAFTVGTDRTKLIGINNCNDPQYTLDVNGSTHQSNNLTTWGVTSDRRIKTNIEFANLDICYSSIQALTLRRYEYDSNVFPNREDKHVIGLVAQEVQPIFPKAVTQTSSFGFSDLLGIDYDQLYMGNLGATKKLMELVEQQGSTIQGIQQQLSTLQKS